MLISPTDAVKNYDVSKPTLYADMKKGKLSFKKDDRGRRKIDVSELERLYERAAKSNDDNKTLPNVNDRKDDTLANSKEAADVEIVYLKRMLKEQKDQYENEIETLKDSLRLAQEGHNKSTLLIEHYTKEKKGDEWQSAIAELKNQIANQEKSANDKFETMAKEKSDIAKANMMYKLTGVLLTMMAIGTTIYVMIEKGIIQLN